jgi:hypothetical protein
VYVVVVHIRRAVRWHPWVLLGSVVVNAKEPIGTSNRRKGNPSGDVGVGLDERISSLVIDVAEDAEENRQQTCEGFSRRQRVKDTSKVLTLLVCS